MNLDIKNTQGVPLALAVLFTLVVLVLVGGYIGFKGAVML